MKNGNVPVPSPPNEQVLASVEDIDLIALLKKVWKDKKTIFRTLLICAIMGVVIAVLTPNQYAVNVIVVPQLGEDVSSKLGELGGLAALAGIDFGMGQQTGADLSPIIYPQIVSSVPFQLELMKTPLSFAGFPQNITLFDYYTKYNKLSVLGYIKKYTIGLPALIIKNISGGAKTVQFHNDSTIQPLHPTAAQVNVQQLLSNLVMLQVNAKEGYLVLTTIMPEPLPAAQLAQKAQELLQMYITEFKIKKAKAYLDFVQLRYNETKVEFEKAQVALAMANDRNKGFTSGLPQVEIDRLQSKFTIAFGVYQEMAKQLEQSKIEVKKNTPVFTIVEPPVVPSEKSGPNRTMILLLWTLVGLLIGVGLIFGSEIWNELKQKWSEN